VSQRVFPGLAKFIEQHEVSMGEFVRPSVLLPLAMMASWLNGVAQSRFVDFILVCGMKK